MTKGRTSTAVKGRTSTAVDGGTSTAVEGRATRPNERQCAMLIAHLLATKEKEVNREVTRARLSEITLQRLFGRQRISPELLVEVQEWLFRVGLVLFFAGTTYVVVRLKLLTAGDGFHRNASMRILKMSVRENSTLTLWSIYSLARKLPARTKTELEPLTATDDPIARQLISRLPRHQQYRERRHQQYRERRHQQYRERSARALPCKAARALPWRAARALP